MLIWCVHSLRGGRPYTPSPAVVLFQVSYKNPHENTLISLRQRVPQIRSTTQIERVHNYNRAAFQTLSCCSGTDRAPARLAEW